METYTYMEAHVVQERTEEQKTIPSSLNSYSLESCVKFVLFFHISCCSQSDLQCCLIKLDSESLITGVDWGVESGEREEVIRLAIWQSQNNINRKRET